MLMFGGHVHLFVPAAREALARFESLAAAAGIAPADTAEEAAQTETAAEAEADAPVEAEADAPVEAEAVEAEEAVAEE